MLRVLLWGPNLIWAKLTASTQSHSQTWLWGLRALNVESIAQSSKLTASTQSHSQTWVLCRGCELCSCYHQTQTVDQLRSISGQTVRDRTESVELFSLSEDQAEKIRYVEAKSDQYERSYVCLKFNSILSRATLARFVRTLQARISAPSDQILLPHILFFASGSDLKKSSLPFFTEKFSSTWKVTSTETDILSNFLKRVAQAVSLRAAKLLCRVSQVRVRFWNKKLHI